MTPVAVGHCHTRYRIPAGHGQARARLQRIVSSGLEQAMDHALEHAGVPPGTLVCIRDLKTIVRVSLRDSDSTLTGRVVDTLSNAVVEAIHRTTSSVVTYSSRGHALADMATNALTGHFERRWAWTQLGIWRDVSAHGISVIAAAEQVMRALIAEPRAAIAVVGLVAKSRPDAFAVLLTRANDIGWSHLARAAVFAAGGSRTLVERLVSPEALLMSVPDARTRVASHDITNTISQIAAHSAIIRAAAGRTGTLSPQSMCVLASLAALEVEPAIVLREWHDVRHVLIGLAQALRASPVVPARPSASPTAAEAPPKSPRQDPADDIGTIPAVRPASVEPTGVAIGARPVDRDPCVVADNPVGPDQVRQRARTRFGGLLYLINVAQEIGWPGVLLRDRRLHARGLTWCLHHIAGFLIDREDDPALLAFAGRRPDQPSPASLEAPASEIEMEALHEHGAQLVMGLRARLTSDDIPDTSLLRAVCEREAVIAADPGWFEIQFLLSDVSLEIRRAGLDRDPGWVPWLGVVVRFAYV